MTPHTIRIYIEKEDGLYNHFSPEKELSEDVIAYIQKKAYTKNALQPLLIQVISAEKIDEAAFYAAIGRWLAEEDAVIEKERRSSKVKQAWMFSAGTFFIALSLLLEAIIPALPFTILSTIGAFAMWEAAAVWIIKYPQLRMRKRMIKKLSSELSFEFQTAAAQNS